MTNAEKFEEIFGLKIDDRPDELCCIINHNICLENCCDTCPLSNFWNKEYKREVIK